LSEEDRAAATVNMYRKYLEVWTCVFLRYAKERETFRHSVTLMAILDVPTEGDTESSRPKGCAKIDS